MKKLLMLAIAGVAVKYFLDSEKGKQLKNKVTGWLGEAQDTFKDAVDTATPKMNPATGTMN